MGRSIGAATTAAARISFVFGRFWKGHGCSQDRLAGRYTRAGTGYPKKTTEGIFSVSEGNMAVFVSLFFSGNHELGMDKST